MTTLIAALVGFITFLATLFGLSMALGLLADRVTVFRILMVQPFRLVATWATFSAAVWLGVIAFGSVAA